MDKNNIHTTSSLSASALQFGLMHDADGEDKTRLLYPIFMLFYY